MLLQATYWIPLPSQDERELLVEGDEDVQNDEIDWEACESFYCLCKL